MPQLALHFLGAPRIELDGSTISLGYNKAVALLAYLTGTPQPHSRETLTAMFWPEHDSTSARGELRRMLWVLNKNLGSGWLVSDRQRVALPPRPDLWWDVAQFRRLLTTSNCHDHETSQACPACLGPLSEAVTLMQDDFLAGFTLPDSPEFDTWQQLERDTLRRELVSALARLVHYHLPEAADQSNVREEALVYSRRWLALDPLDEEAHRQLMLLLAQSGQRSAALSQYKKCCQVLAEELGVGPSVETTTLHERILAGQLLPESAQRQLTRPFTLSGSMSRPPESRDVSLNLPAFLQADSDPEPVQGEVFIGREHELTRLEAYLDTALSGHSQIAFTVGEAGQGKTSLLRAFAHQAQQKHPDLVVAMGSCEVFSGVGDPFLPFRDVMAMLTADIEAEWIAGTISRDHAMRLWTLLPHAVRALSKLGPGLIDTLVPSAALLERAAVAAPDGAVWLDNLRVLLAEQTSAYGQRADQEHFFQAYTGVLKELASRQPLLLLLDDLHWADLSSLDLLAYLGRRLERSPIMIVGAYRPEDIALGRAEGQHPLAGLLSEFKRHYGPIMIDLNQANDGGRRFVDAYLDQDPNQLDDEFRRWLTWYTGGHPLFVVELLREMRERGDLVHNRAGRWVAASDLAWGALPMRIEGVVEKRIDRVDPELRQILTVASVEGETFTAEAVARAMSLEESYVIRRLSQELAVQHRLVQARGIRYAGAQRLSQYQFRHNLFQTYLYGSIDSIERSYLHEATGRSLEALYGVEIDHNVTLVGQLARHFAEAGLVTQAVSFWQKAGELAVRSYANHEAVIFYQRAIALLGTLEDTAERAQQELRLQLALGSPIAHIKGYACPEIEQIYRRARELSPQVEATKELFITFQGLCFFYLVRGKLQPALDMAEQCLELAQRLQDSVLLVGGYRMAGGILLFSGQPKQAWRSLAQGLDLFVLEQQRSLVDSYALQNDGLFCHTYGAISLWLQGYPEQALATIQRGVTLALEEDDPNTLILFLSQASMVFQFCQRSETAKQLTEKGLAILGSQGTESHLVGFMRFMHGSALFAQNRQTDAVVEMSEGLSAFRTVGATMLAQVYMPVILAQAYGQAGQVNAGLTLVDETLAGLDDYEERFWEAELYRLKGELLSQAEGEGRRDGLSPKACFHHALEVARQQGAKSLELRAVMSLCRLWHAQGVAENREEARQMLIETYGWFSEGFDTADLQEAGSLLEELS